MPVSGKHYNCLIVKNCSDVKITVYFYTGYSPWCNVSNFSKILEPKENHRYHNENSFKFDIFTHEENKKLKRLLEPKECNDVIVITINQSLNCQYCTVAAKDKQIIHRLIERENEFPPGDLYEQLGLDRKEVRKMKKENLKKAVTTGFRKVMLIWHPDRLNGNSEAADRITQARDILLDDERRATYHNLIDYEKGWLSSGRWKAIFWSECGSEEQRKAYRKRMFLFGMSSLIAVGGIITIFTGGVGLPLLAGLGMVAAGDNLWVAALVKNQ